MFANEARFEQGLATIGGAEMKNIGQFLKWVMSDIQKSQDELDASDLEWSNDGEELVLGESKGNIMELVIQYLGRESIVNSIEELIMFCCSKNDDGEVLWWRDDDYCTDKNPWGYRDFTNAKLLQQLEKDDELTLQFGPADKSNTGEIFFIYTEKGYAKMQSDVEDSMTEMAQDEANRTGKTAIVGNLMGKLVSVQPKR